MKKNSKQISVVQSQIEESIALEKKVKSEFSEKIVKLADILNNCIKRGGKILLCGNGGSAADAQHIAGELVVRLRSSSKRRALPAIADCGLK
jgi:D-sedoheptulose 7-phosphate isomerase